MKNILYVIFFLMISGLHATAQDNPIRSAFDNYNKSEYQEKLYIHTDKPYYTAGDQVWFKAYLQNSHTRQRGISNFIYVELVNKANEVTRRVKIRRDEFGFHGQLPIPEDLPSDDYQLRGYTLWMQNIGEDYFFKKTIAIENVADKRIKITPEFTYENNKVKVNLTVKDRSGKPVNGVAYNITSDGKQVKRINTDKAGQGNFDITIRDRSKRLYVDVEPEKSEGGSTVRMYIPLQSEEYDITFHPESGSLLAGESQFIGFKAIGTDGLSRDVEGTVYNQNDELIANFQSIHKGMGKFLLTPNAGDKYYARVKDSNGVEKRLDLPLVDEKGIALQILKRRDNYLYKINNQTGIAPENLYFLAFQGEYLLFARPLDSENMEGVIPAAGITPGIITFAIADNNMNVLCQRLTFAKGDECTISMQSNQPVYRQREKVELEFQVLDKNEKPLTGEYSLAVLDKGVVEDDSLGINILAGLLLTSDLKGYIEEPGYYFLGDDNARAESLDALMMTQGWTRFDLTAVLSGNYPEPPYEMEVGQIISGKVQRLTGRPFANAQVMMMKMPERSISLASADAQGKFVIDGIAFTDSTTFTLNSMDEKGKTGSTVLAVDEDIFPAVNAYIPNRDRKKEEEVTAYQQSAVERYRMEGSHRLIDLMEVEIVSQKKKTMEEQMHDMRKSQARFTITSQDLEEKYPGMTILEVLEVTPFLTVDQVERSVLYRNSPVIFVVDEVKSDYDYISMMHSNDIENMYILTDPVSTAIYTSSGSAVVSLVMKRGYVPNRAPVEHARTIRPLGYQKPQEFYMPKYETTAEKESKTPDFRSTVYWEPRIRPDEEGTFKVSFYTNDSQTDFQVILEGVSYQGKIGRYKATIKRQ